MAEFMMSEMSKSIAEATDWLMFFKYDPPFGMDEDGIGRAEWIVWRDICCIMKTEESAISTWRGWLDMCREERDAVVSIAILGKESPGRLWQIAYRLHLRNELREGYGKYRVNVFSDKMLSLHEESEDV